MNRTVIFAHFDPKNVVQPYVLYYLARLRPLCSRVWFVSTSELSRKVLSQVEPSVDEIFLRPNVGFDFAMWRYCLDRCDIADTDELLLTNSSVYGPVFPLGPVLERMANTGCDFWAMTDSAEIRWHLQSYFLLFKRRVLHSQAFHEFWGSVLPYANKHQTILSYELGCTTYLSEQHFAATAYAALDHWATPHLKSKMNHERKWNPTLFYPRHLLQAGMPFVKVALIRENVGNVRLDPVLRTMSKEGYPIELIDRK